MGALRPGLVTAAKPRSLRRTEWVEAFAEEVREASPDSRVIIPRHLEPIQLPDP